MECPQRADGAFAQRQPAYLEKDETFTRCVDDPRLRRQRNLLRGAAAQPDQLAHFDTLRRVAQQRLHSFAGKQGSMTAPPPRVCRAWASRAMKASPGDAQRGASNTSCTRPLAPALS